MEDMVTAAILRGFYTNKKVLITGHTGFKGSWLTAALHYFGAVNTGYALAPEYEEGIFNFIDATHPCTSIINDIRNRTDLAKTVTDVQPDVIFHLAAQPLVRDSYEKPAETFEVNVSGTANLLESVKNLNNKCAVVVVTTDKVYLNHERDIPYTEADRLGGYDPYSASKACAELVADSFRHSFFNITELERHKKSVATVRAGNVIGGGDWSRDRILPDIVRSLRAGRPVLVRNPESVRPWQHVLEAVSGYLILAMKLYLNEARFSGAYNLGPLPEDHIPVKDLVRTAIDAWGSGEWSDVSNQSSPHEAGLLKLDIRKALKELDWEPKLNAAQAILWTIDWYKASNDEKSDCTYQQIKEYFVP